MATKESARRIVYERLMAGGAARFPFPIEGRIPNFRGAEAAAAQLRNSPLYREAEVLKVGPDSPLLPVRVQALRDGKTILLPAPRLRGGFLVLDPKRIPAAEVRRAASLRHAASYGEETAVADLPPVQLVVAGSVAVTRDGARAGKGEGYSDIEYGILRALGHPEIPVATVVHPLQILDDPAERFEPEPHDLSVDLIATPAEWFATRTPYPKPDGIDWERLPPERLDAMPVLRELRFLTWERLTVPDVVAPGLRVLFVGINPGRWTAVRGHHFAGPGNHFWPLLYHAGFTPRRFAPDEDALLLELGYGITNLVERATRGEDGLAWEEMQRGGAVLREKVAALRPKLVALLGKEVYRAYAGLPRSARFEWGLQERQTVAGVREFAAPNPSARSTISFERRLELFRELKRLADE